ncbi:MAG: phosphate acyltransferase PlsX [Oscillospiraceae bacterium]|nr:phosphate acyltransferase PlsX [Oscillospiraceae bacterium]
MKIIVDAMGGDFAPLAPVKGALLAHERYGTEIILTGRTEDILRAVRECGREELPAGVEIVNAEQVVEICDDPSTAFKQKKDSSLTVGLNLLRDGQADGFVCAGSTGALLAGATLVVKRIRGLRRAALSPTIPTATGKAVLIDCGANAECTVEYLLQFAYLGSYYAEKVLGVERPRVGLLNIGAEESKGDELRRETYRKLKEAGAAGHLNFVGNVEAKEAMMGACDVIVSDGYSGNIMLKSIEGAGKLMAKELKAVLMKNAGTKLAALLLKSGLAGFKKMLDPNEVGGTALLGISKPVVKAHGSSNEVAFCNAIRQAVEVAQSGIIADIEANIDKMRISRED